MTTVLQGVQRVLKGHLLGQAGMASGEGQGGAVTVVQRFGSAANLKHSPALPGAGRGVSVR